MKTINIFIDEYNVIKENKEKYPCLYRRAVHPRYEETMTDWLRLSVTEPVYEEFEKLKEDMKGEIKMTVLTNKTYDNPILGINFFSDSLVSVIGEQTVVLETGKVVEQYIYNIEGYTPENGKPFIGLKANIQLT